ncbi:MAG: histidine kinase [Oryzomonas sp.]|uniref:cache domain-containing sensor histidine kinase n=1 Tax=Oryzomonas sp. TaxID=2855186 RepID=UPI00283DBBBB|nr:histidine kinase [Oryzomonas sp.]MDR3580108.1 histidine kinase [Oryzomonas sp.]
MVKHRCQPRCLLVLLMIFFPKTSKSTVSTPVFITRLTATVLAINLFVFALATLFIHQSRHQYEERAVVATQNLSQALEANISGLIDKADVALRSVIDEAEKQTAEGGINSDRLNLFIARQLERVPELNGLRMANEKGFTVLGTGVKPGAAADNSDRDYFHHARNEPTSDVFISKPMFGRVANIWVLNISRRVNKPDGSFAGVAYAAISVDSMLKLFSALDVGNHGVITLRDSDLGIVARYPDQAGIDSVIGQKNVSQGLSELIKQGESSGTYEDLSAVDNIIRSYSFHKISHYPLYVTVGRASGDYLAEWYGEVIKICVLIALFTTVTIISSILIIHRWNCEKLAEAELLRHRDNLENLIQDRTKELENRNELLAEEISERKKTEEALHEREEELRQMLHTLRSLSTHMESVREVERKRIAREIHDELGQMLTVLRFDLFGLKDKLSGAGTEIIEKIDLMITQASDSIKSVQRICADLRPQVLDNLGLAEAFDWLVQEFSKRTGIKCNLTIDESILHCVGDERAIILFRIFQELFTNIARHAEATEVAAIIVPRDSCCFLEVSDNGKGIEAEQVSSGSSFGIIGIRERTEICGGSVDILGEAGKGTTIRISIPCTCKEISKDENPYDR